MTAGKVVLYILLPLLLLGGAGAYWYQSREPAPRWVTQKIGRGDVAQVVNATGTVNPVVTSPVGAQVSGIVWKLHADFNDVVKKGQVLVELDPAIFKSNLDREKANLLAAIAMVAKAKADLDDAHHIAERSVALAEKNFIAMQDRDTAVAKEHSAKAAVQSAEAQVVQQRAVVENFELNLRNSVILSPVDGVVIARNVELGQAVVSSFQAPNIFTIANDLKKMQVLANVDEADIGLLKEGQVATFTVDAFRNRQYTGTVAQVRNAAQTVQNVVTYVVVLNVDNTDLSLRPGMTANVRLVAAKREDVLLLPNGALRFKPPLDAVKGEGRRGGHGDGPDGGAAGEAGKKRHHGEGHGGADSASSTDSAQRSGAPSTDSAQRSGAPSTDSAQRSGAPSAEGARQRDSNRASVWVPVGPAGLKRVTVTTGITDGMQTEVLSGLQEGDEVITDQVRQQTSAPPGMPGMGPQQQRGGGGGGRRGF